MTIAIPSRTARSTRSAAQRRSTRLFTPGYSPLRTDGTGFVLDGTIATSYLRTVDLAPGREDAVARLAS